MIRIRNCTGYPTPHLRHLINLSIPACCQPNSFMQLLMDRKGTIRFCNLPDPGALGRDLAWPSLVNRFEASMVIDLPQYLCPTVSILRCLHWAGSRGVWVEPPRTLDYWHEIEAKVGQMLVAPVTPPQPKKRRRRARTP